MVRQPTSDSVYWHAPSGSSCGAGRSFASNLPLRATSAAPARSRKLQAPNLPRCRIARYDRLPIVDAVRSHDSQGLPSPRSSVKAPAAKLFVLVTNASFPSPRSAPELSLRLFLLHRLPSLPDTPFCAIETLLQKFPVQQSFCCLAIAGRSVLRAAGFPAFARNTASCPSLRIAWRLYPCRWSRPSCCSWYPWSSKTLLRHL